MHTFGVGKHEASTLAVPPIPKVCGRLVAEPRPAEDATLKERHIILERTLFDTSRLSTKYRRVSQSMFRNLQTYEQHQQPVTWQTRLDHRHQLLLTLRLGLKLHVCRHQPLRVLLKALELHGAIL